MMPTHTLPVYAVIMAGGSGERFWPLSRKRKPKQLLPLGAGGRTMLEEALDRIAPIVASDHVLIVTSETLRQPIIDALPQLPQRNVIAEPFKRNTAPCLALAAAEIIAREGHGRALMAVLTADHFIGDAEAFRNNIVTALAFAEREHALVTLGIRPTRPETGYGYIELAPATTVHSDAVREVVAFREKPNVETAIEYVHGGRHLWNSGMFFWRVEVFENDLRACLPEVGNAIQTLADELRTIGDIAASQHTMEASSKHVAQTFESLPDVSIDYGLLEQAKRVAVVPATFAWDDVGSWDALLRVPGLATDDMAIVGNVIQVDTAHSVIVNAHADPHVLAVLGLENVVVVSTPDATLVCSKERTQDVKRIVNMLKSDGREDVL